MRRACLLGSKQFQSGVCPRVSFRSVIRSHREDQPERKDRHTGDSGGPTSATLVPPGLSVRLSPIRCASLRFLLAQSKPADVARSSPVPTSPIARSFSLSSVQLVSACRRSLPPEAHSIRPVRRSPWVRLASGSRRISTQQLLLSGDSRLSTTTDRRRGHARRRETSQGQLVSHGRLTCP